MVFLSQHASTRAGALTHIHTRMRERTEGRERGGGGGELQSGKAEDSLKSAVVVLFVEASSLKSAVVVLFVEASSLKSAVVVFVEAGLLPQF